MAIENLPCTDDFSACHVWSPEVKPYFFAKQYLSHDDPCSTILNTIRTIVNYFGGFLTMWVPLVTIHFGGIFLNKNHPLGVPLWLWKPPGHFRWGSWNFSWAISRCRRTCQVKCHGCWVLFAYLGVPWSCLDSLWIGWTGLNIVFIVSMVSVVFGSTVYMYLFTHIYLLHVTQACKNNCPFPSHLDFGKGEHQIIVTNKTAHWQ